MPIQNVVVLQPTTPEPVRGSLILNFDEFINNLGGDFIQVNINNVVVKRQYTDVIGLYMWRLNVGDAVRLQILTSPSNYRKVWNIIRRDYTTDDINGDNGIRDTFITSGNSFTNPSVIDFTVAKDALSYNFEYILTISTDNSATPTPTPTPTATPIPTGPTATPTSTPTSTPTVTPTVTPTPTMTGGTATINYYFAFGGTSNRSRTYYNLRGGYGFGLCEIALVNVTSSATSASYSGTTTASCVASSQNIGADWLVYRNFSPAIRCTGSSYVMKINGVTIDIQTASSFNVPLIGTNAGGTFLTSGNNIVNGDVIDIFIDTNFNNL